MSTRPSTPHGRAPAPPRGSRHAPQRQAPEFVAALARSPRESPPSELLSCCRSPARLALRLHVGGAQSEDVHARLAAESDCLTDPAHSPKGNWPRPLW